MGFLVTPGASAVIVSVAMQHGFFQKLLLAIIAGAMAAGLIEFYKTFVSGSMEAVNGGYHTPGTARTPAPTPRRF